MTLATPFKPLPTLKVSSSEPFEFSRAMWLRGAPLKVEKSPPISTLPSDWRAIVQIVPFAPVPGSKVSSSAPFACKRATRLRSTPLQLVKAPASNRFPSDWTTTA